MRDAFRAAYPPGRSALGQIFIPAVHPRTFLRALHLGLMFPLGIAYFVVLVTVLAIGGSLIWTIVGPVALLIALYFTRWAGDIEALMVRDVAGIELRRPPTAIERGQSFREQVKTRLIDPTTWTGLVYLFVQFPVGIASFVLLVAGGAVTGSFVGAPLWLMAADAPPHIEIDLGFWSMVDPTPTEALVLVPIGVAAYLVTVHLVTTGSALHAAWARLMLGSRAEPVALVAPQPPSAGPAPDDDTPSERPTSVEGEGASAEPMTVHESVETAPAVALLPERVAPTLVAMSGAVEELTPREREVLTLIARGYSNAAIAETFVISEGTVKTHVKRVLAKLELRDRTQAAIWAYETGFVTVAPSGDGATSVEPVPISTVRAR